MNEKTKSMISKVPAVTIFFWIIKVLCTTVGETASDFLNVNLGLGLVGTSIFMGTLFLIVLFLQFRTTKYTPSIYWPTVVLISVFGTLVTDNLTDGMGVPLEFSTILFSVCLALTFAHGITVRKICPSTRFIPCVGKHSIGWPFCLHSR